MTLLLRIVFSWFLGLVLWAVPATAQEQNFDDRMLVIDMSGSMQAKLGNGLDRAGAAKLFGDRFVSRSTALQPDARLGLTAFGHAGKSCDNIQTLLAPAPLASADGHAGKLSDEIARLKPIKGSKTPLLQSILEAAEQLPDGGVIVLVSDFTSTCDFHGLELCEAYKELKKTKLLRINLFRIVTPVKKSDRIKAVSDFAACARTAIDRVDSPEQALELAEGIAEELFGQSAPAELAVRFRMEPEPDIAPRWGAPPLDGSIRIAGRSPADAVISAFEHKFSLKPGRYDIEARVAGRIQTDVIGLTAGERGASVTFDVPSARLTLTARGPGGEPVGAGRIEWTVRDTSGAVATSGDSPALFTLPPGHYTITALSSIGGAEIVLDLPAGELISEAVVLDPGLRKSPASQPAAAAFVLSWTMEAIDPSLFGSGQQPELQLTAANAATAALRGLSGTHDPEAGTYDLSASWYGYVIALPPLMAAGGDSVELRFTLVPFQVVADVAGTPGDIVWKITQLASGASVDLGGPRLVQSLPPGDYRIEAEAGGSRHSRIVTAVPGGRLDLAFP